MKLLVVLDTNGLLQCISHRNYYYPIWDAFIKGKYVLCISNEILEEYEELLSRYTSSKVAQLIVETILRANNVQYTDPHFRLQLISSDPDDNKFVDCAFACGADHIVSEDVHFKALKNIPFPTFNVITMQEFLIKLES